MSEADISRRNLLRNVALAASLGGLTAEAAQHVHQAAAREKTENGAYVPKVFNAHEWATLDAFTELIVPGAGEAGTREFIDLLSSGTDELAVVFTGGLGWLDRESEDRFGAMFIAATPSQQIELLDLLAYRENTAPELQAGIRFFAWARRMVVDAYYTSAIGIAEIGYEGNKGMTQFSVPREAIDYAVSRSPKQ